MFSLILAVIAIALIAAVATAGLSYIEQDMGSAHETRSVTHTGFSLLGSAFLSYRIDQGVNLPVAGWEAALTPDYTFFPNTPEGVVWSYGTNGTGGYWFCLSGDAVKSSQYKGLAALREGYSAQAYFLSGACGASADGTAPATFPAAAAATYWITPP